MNYVVLYNEDGVIKYCAKDLGNSTWNVLVADIPSGRRPVKVDTTTYELTLEAIPEEMDYSSRIKSLEDELNALLKQDDTEVSAE